MADAVGRNIILLSDGTGNSAGKLFKTNVWRIYDALDLSNASQIASYDDGVGTSSIKPLAVLGGAFGWGLKRNVLALYMFLCRNYKSGDRIYAFGFSRGAFTIRVLVRFVLFAGLVDNPNSNDDLRAKSLRLYRKFRVNQTRYYGLHTVARPLRDLAVFLKDCITGQRRAMSEFERVPVPEIEFVGLWDTVDAYGLPVEELGKGVDQWIWPLSLNDKDVDGRIKKVCHALSIDDKRTTFHPLLWDESETAGLVRHTDQEVLTQVWFSGVHGNVGGGYPDDALSYVPLRWMIREAEKRKLTFSPLAMRALELKISPYGKIYNSRAGLGAYYRYEPRRLDPPRDHQGACIPMPKIHESVIWRIAMGTDGYAPLSLPNEIRIVTDARPALPSELAKPPAAGEEDKLAPELANILSFTDYCRAVQDKQSDLFGAPAGCEADPERRERVADDFRPLATPDDKMLALIWDTVWWRRIAYFSTLIVTASLLLFPAIFPSNTEEAVNNPITRVAGHMMLMLPEAMRPWVESFQTYPEAIATLTGLLVVFVLWGSLIDRRIHDRALAAWNRHWRAKRREWLEDSLRKRRRAAFVLAIPFLLSLAGAVLTLADASILTVLLFIAALLLGLPATMAGIYALVLWRMTRRLGQQVEVRGPALLLAHALSANIFAVPYRIVAINILPTVFAAGLLVAIAYGASRVVFDFMESGGGICSSSGNRTDDFTEKTIDLKAKEQCFDTGLNLLKNVNYRFDIVSEGNWTDDKIPVTPKGVSTYAIGWHKWWQLPLRRRLTSQWFAIIARVGDKGVQDHALRGTRSEYAPLHDGPLFLFANDAVIGFFQSDRFYADNDGIMQLKITKLGPVQR